MTKQLLRRFAAGFAITALLIGPTLVGANAAGPVAKSSCASHPTHCKANPLPKS